MTGKTAFDASIDPERLFEAGGFETDERTYTHGDPDHCEAEAAGRAIVGVTDGHRVLLAVRPEDEHAILPNTTLDAGEDWTTAIREHVEGMAGIDVRLDGVERVRRVEHRVEAEDGGTTHQRTTHHVVFAASADSAAELDGLCEDNEWELGWYGALPVEVEDDDSGVLDDIRLFLG